MRPSTETINSVASIQELGTDAAIDLTAPSISLTAKTGIGIEVMDLRAACRTYNILVAEERKVAAALLFE